MNRRLVEAMPKNYASTFLYKKFDGYDKKIFEFIMKSEVIDKTADGFDDIIFDIKKRQVSPALVKVLLSDAVVLLIGEESMGRQFKSFCAKDIRNGKKDDLKIYIDCSNVIVKNKHGVWSLKNPDVFISYLTSAMTSYIYYKDEKRLTNNTNIINHGAYAFSDLFTYIIDYLVKINSTPKNKSYCKYMAVQYYISNILQKDHTTPGNLAIARKISGLSEREADIVEMQIEDYSYDNIKFFVETLANVLRQSKLTIDTVVEKWLFLYGPGTVFGMELFPAFSAMLTDCYIGAYVNNQKTIEKVAGQHMVQFCKSILQIGADSV